MTRRGLATGLLVTILAGLLVGGVLRVRVDTGIDSFLPRGHPALAGIEQKARDFGGDPVVVLLRSAQPRALIADRAQLLGLLRLEGRLARLPDVASVYGPGTTVNQLAGAAQAFLAQIAGRRDGLRIAAEQEALRQGRSAEEAAAAGRAATGELVLRYAPLLVRGLPVGLPTLENAAFAAAVIYGPDGEPRPQWRFLAPDTGSVAVLVRPRQDLDQAGTRELVAAVRAAVGEAGLDVTATTISGVPAITADLTGQVVRELPLVAALVAVVVLLRFLLAPAPALGSRGSRCRWPPLAAPGQLAHPAEGVRSRSRRWWPPLAATLLGSAGTFACFGWLGRPLSFGALALLPLLLGIGSTFPLYLSALRDRSLVLVVAAASAAAFAALALSPLPFVGDLGLALAIGVTLTVVAALLLPRTTARAGEQPEEPWPDRRPVCPVPRLTRAAALLAALAVAGTGWVGLGRLDVRADPRELAAGVPALEDAQLVERALGSSGELGLVLRGPDVLAPEALDWSRLASDAVTATFGDRVRPVLGAPELFAFLGEDPTPAQVSAALELVPSYLTSAVVRPDRGAGVQVFGIRLQDMGDQAELLDGMRAALPPVPEGYSAELVGLPVVAVAGYRALLDDRYLVNVVGIALAGAVLAAGLRRRADAGRAVVAATLAAGWGFAALWLLGIPLSPLTVGLGALVTVTGCEFAVLLTERLRGRRLGSSVGFACLTSAAGYGALAVSGLDVMREFGLVLAGAVVLSYLAARLAVWAFPSAPARPTAAGPYASTPEREEAPV